MKRRLFRCVPVFFSSLLLLCSCDGAGGYYLHPDGPPDDLDPRSEYQQGYDDGYSFGYDCGHKDGVVSGTVSAEEKLPNYDEELDEAYSAGYQDGLIDGSAGLASSADYERYAQARVDAVYKSLFEGQVNPYTGRPVCSEQDFIDYQRSYYNEYGVLPDPADHSGEN